MKISVICQITESNTLNIAYKAKTDITTHINLTNHAYFNLNGKGSILGHELHLNCKGYLEVDDHLIPSGIINPSINTRFDFLKQSGIGRKDFAGFDDTIVLNDRDVKASLH